LKKSRIEIGIQGLDDLIGGLPENSSTLVYGPPKTGKSVFCYEFALHGLKIDEPCLYLAADYDLRQLRQNLLSYDWSLEEDMEEENIYLIDAISNLAGAKKPDTDNYKNSSVQDPTDLMVKIGLGTRFLYQHPKNFRAVLDSLTTLFAFNPDKMVLRLLNAYIRRIKEASGTAIISYTEGITDTEIENILKTSMDNIFHFDGKRIFIEAMMDFESMKIPYSLTENGIWVE
jgi:KaiC/GvpD/RAD55 family RecA-like ATPase